MPKQPYNPVLRAAILEIVDNQLRDGTPPETRATLERLMAEGIPEKEARELIACVVSTEICDILQSGQVYQEERCVAGLRALPRLPWENDEQGRHADKRAFRRRATRAAFAASHGYAIRAMVVIGRCQRPGVGPVRATADADRVEPGRARERDCRAEVTPGWALTNGPSAATTPPEGSRWPGWKRLA